MIDSEQPLQISCNHLLESPSTIPTTTTMTTTTRTTAATIVHQPTTSLIPQTTDSTRSNQKRRHTLSYILILTIVFVVVLLLLNLLLIVLCWRQRRPKKSIDSKTNRPFICSSTSSSSSITYGGTPMLTSLDPQKQQTLSSRYVLQSNQSHMDTTPSTSTTTATGPYEDLNDSMTLQRHCHHEKSPDNHSLYTQHRPTISTPNMAYNRMIHFPPRPIRCHFSIPAQTFYPPQPLFDSQHIYETIQDGHCPYQRLAATLRRQQHKQQPQPPQCTCYYEHSEQQAYPTRTHDDVNATGDLNPETLVWEENDRWRVFLLLLPTFDIFFVIVSLSFSLDVVKWKNNHTNTFFIAEKIGYRITPSRIISAHSMPYREGLLSIGSIINYTHTHSFVLQNLINLAIRHTSSAW